jgi:hypothetical protein
MDGQKDGNGLLLNTHLQVTHFSKWLSFRQMLRNEMHHSTPRKTMINPSKPKHIQTCKNSVHTSKRTPHFTITKISWLMLFIKIIIVYTENDRKPINNSITDCYSRWYTKLPLGFKGLSMLLITLWNHSLTPPISDFQLDPCNSFRHY